MSPRESDAALRRADAQARKMARSVFDRPLVLEAGAGTGKTTTLVARIVAWTMGPGWDLSRAALLEDPLAVGPPADDRVAARVLSRLVAITFTEAAAAEMEIKVGIAISDLERGQIPHGMDEDDLPPAEHRNARARSLLAALDHLVVRTIHAWCRGILATHPLEAGIHPNFVVDADGELRAEVIRDLVEEQLRLRYGASLDDDLLLLAAHGIGPVDIFEALNVLAAKGVRADDLSGSPLSPERMATWHADLLQTVTTIEPEVVAGLAEAGGRSSNTVGFAAWWGAARERLGQGPPKDTAELTRLRDELGDENVDAARKRLNDWCRTAGLNKTEQKLLDPEQQRQLLLAAPRLRTHLDALDRLEPELLEASWRVIVPLLREVERRLRARGALGFSDLLRGARDLIADNGRVRARLRRDIDQLLVDEFQDTDGLQCDLIGMLALDGDADTRPGLFLVGDPKQSIYGWRSADLAAYESFVARVVAAGGTRRSLTVNFRSAPVLLEEVERVVSPIMEHQDGLQPAFQRLLACDARVDDEGFRDDGRLPVEYWITRAGSLKSSKDEAIWGPCRVVDGVEIEAQWLARDIAALADKGGSEFRYDEVAILMRSKSSLDRYLEALRAAGIPFNVESDRSYFQRREIIDAAALVRCILEPHDQLALVTALRSLIGGLPDAALLPLWSQGLPEHMARLSGDDTEALDSLDRIVDSAAAAIPHEVPGLGRIAGWQESVKLLIRQIARLRECFLHDEPDAFVEKLRVWSCGELVESARYLGPHRAANLERFYRHLVEAMSEAGGDPRSVLRTLRRAVAEQSEAEEGRPQESAENAVQVMTIHKAKGLDFTHVYLVQADKQKPAGSGRVRTRVRTGRRRLELSLLGFDSLGFAAAGQLEDEVEAYERVRLLYVALTRAKRRVVVAGAWKDPWTPRPVEKADSLAELLQHRTGNPPGIRELAEGLERRGEPSREDTSGVGWLAPTVALANTSGMRVDRHGGTAEPIRIEPIAEEVDRLLACRREARARMERPWSKAASEATSLTTKGDATAPSRAPDAAAEEIAARAAAPLDYHESLRDEVEDRRAAPGEAAPNDVPAALQTAEADGVRRRTAMAAGSAVHAFLEHFDATTPRGEMLARGREIVDAEIAQLLEADERAAAREMAGVTLDRLAAGSLLDRLAALDENILARELPILARPELEGDLDAPVGYRPGAIDLLYRDPQDGQIVVADYKSDAVEDEAALAERMEHYRRQGAVYQRAVQEALGLPAQPRFELWFLREGRVEVVS